MRKTLYNWFIERVPVDVEGKAKVTETEEIKLLNVLLAVFIAWFVVGAALFFYEDRGTFGDMFGSINTIFSGFAFGGIIYTIYQQRAEFRLQREELRLQREEVAKTNEAMTEQIKAANIQRFESTFFQLISLHNEIVRDIKRQERESFSQLRNGLIEMAEMEKNQLYGSKDANSLNESEQLIVISYACERYFRYYEPKLGAYLRNLYNLLRMVEKNEWIKELEQEKEYTRIIRSQLSANEQIILFYNCFQTKGRKFKYFADRYDLFDNMVEDLLLHPSHYGFYNKVKLPEE
ncbi:putative phage abortive infection protein [Paenibacillus sp. FSL R5-0519]|uniref:putative phage abortive infection protein n=1 Tax=Paenibacillus sp. FSL R5-0519 TaxID=2921648 RepID=UPI0030DA9497